MGIYQQWDACLVRKPIRELWQLGDAAREGHEFRAFQEIVEAVLCDEVRNLRRTPMEVHFVGRGQGKGGKGQGTQWSRNDYGPKGCAEEASEGQEWSNKVDQDGERCNKGFEKSSKCRRRTRRE